MDAQGRMVVFSMNKVVKVEGLHEESLALHLNLVAAIYSSPNFMAYPPPELLKLFIRCISYRLQSDDSQNQLLHLMVLHSLALHHGPEIQQILQDRKIVNALFARLISLLANSEILIVIYSLSILIRSLNSPDRMELFKPESRNGATTISLALITVAEQTREIGQEVRWIAAELACMILEMDITNSIVRNHMDDIKRVLDTACLETGNTYSPAMFLICRIVRGVKSDILEKELKESGFAKKITEKLEATNLAMQYNRNSIDHRSSLCTTQIRDSEKICTCISDLLNAYPSLLEPVTFVQLWTEIITAITSQPRRPGFDVVLRQASSVFALLDSCLGIYPTLHSLLLQAVETNCSDICDMITCVSNDHLYMLVFKLLGMNGRNAHVMRLLFSTFAGKESLSSTEGKVTQERIESARFQKTSVSTTNPVRIPLSSSVVTAVEAMQRKALHEMETKNQEILSLLSSMRLTQADTDDTLHETLERERVSHKFERETLNEKIRTLETRLQGLQDAYDKRDQESAQARDLYEKVCDAMSISRRPFGTPRSKATRILSDKENTIL